MPILFRLKEDRDMAAREPQFCTEGCEEDWEFALEHGDCNNNNPQ